MSLSIIIILSTLNYCHIYSSSQHCWGFGGCHTSTIQTKRSHCQFNWVQISASSALEELGDSLCQLHLLPVVKERLLLISLPARLHSQGRRFPSLTHPPLETPLGIPWLENAEEVLSYLSQSLHLFDLATWHYTSDPSINNLVPSYSQTTAMTIQGWTCCISLHVKIMCSLILSTLWLQWE